MKLNQNNLEGNILFRFIKVAYITAFLLLVAIVGIAAWIYKPYDYLDDSRSYITCFPSNKTLTYDAVDEYIRKIPNSYNLNLINFTEKANYICEEEIGRGLKYRYGKEGTARFYEKAEVYSDFDKEWFINNNENRGIIISNVKAQYPGGIYSPNVVNSTNGSWQTVFWILVLGLSGVYVSVSLIYETLLYVIFGKTYTLEWLNRAWKVLKK